MAGAFSSYRKDEKGLIGFGAKPEEKITLGRPRCRMER
jgi:hypothetical protein